MKAALLTGPGKIEIRDVPDPRIRGEEEVLLRTAAVGVCGSDVHYYLRGRIGDQIVEYPFIVGHECAAVVEEVGPGVTSLQPGDRVAVDPAVSCGECDQCTAGRAHTCRNLLFLGCPGQMEGSLCEYFVMPERNAYLLDEKISFTQAVIAEPLSIGLYATTFLPSLEQESIGILGAGPIGMSVLVSLKRAGNPSLYVTDKIPERLDIASGQGAVWTGNPLERDVVRDIQDKSPGLDAVFECCGEQEALDQAVELLRPGGKLLILGIPETSRVSFDIHRLRRKELEIFNIRRQNACFREALDQIGESRVHIDFMATHSFPLEKASGAFDLVSRYGDGVMKAIIRF